MWTSKSPTISEPGAIFNVWFCKCVNWLAAPKLTVIVYVPPSEIEIPGKEYVVDVPGNKTIVWKGFLKVGGGAAITAKVNETDSLDYYKSFKVPIS